MKWIKCNLCGAFRSDRDWRYITVTNGLHGEFGDVTHYCGQQCLANDYVSLADTVRIKAHLAELGEAVAAPTPEPVRVVMEYDGKTIAEFWAATNGFLARLDAK